MQLDYRLGRAKRSPWKQRQTQIYGRGIQGVDGVVQIDAKNAAMGFFEGGKYREPICASRAIGRKFPSRLIIPDLCELIF